MGFGLLFIGYFIAFLMSFHRFGWIFRIVGFYIIFLALGKLSEYKRSMKKCLMPLLLMTLCEVYTGIFSMGNLIDPDISSPVVITSLVGAAFEAMRLIFHIFLFLAIRQLSSDVGDRSIEALAQSSIFIAVLYTVCNTVITILKSGFEITNRYLIIFISLFSILFPLLVLYVLFRCYAGICAPEDADMKPKPSRFAFINKSRELSEKKDREMQDLIKKVETKKQNKKKK